MKIIQKNSKYLPLVLITLYVLIINLIYLSLFLFKAGPVSPWDSAIVLESWRYLNNLPIYEDKILGHSTHIYGFITSYLNGNIFYLTGINNYTPRLLSLLSSILFVSLLTVNIKNNCSKILVLFILIFLFSLNYRSWSYFVHARPDMISLLFVLISLNFFYLGINRNKIILFLVGAILLIIAFFLKQTAALFALTPLIAILISKEINRINIAMVLLPPALILTTLLILKLYYPHIAYYMLDIPNAYSINFAQLATNSLLLIITSPFFILFLMDIIFNNRKYIELKSQLFIWIISVNIIAFVLSLLAASKYGGTFNSYLPALFGLNSIFLFYLSDYTKVIFNTGSELLNKINIIVISIFVFITIFPLYLNPSTSITDKLGNWSAIFYISVFLLILFLIFQDRYKNFIQYIERYNIEKVIYAFLVLIIIIPFLFLNYSIIPMISHRFENMATSNINYIETINELKEFNGKVISPEDPTLTLFGLGQYDKNIYIEYDSNPSGGIWPNITPQYVKEYIQDSDYLLNVEDWYHDLIDEIFLRDLGFIKEKQINQNYSIWKKRGIK